jgi:quercetin dioxygenase-like cupin family protein
LLIGNWDDLDELESRPGIFRQVYTESKLQVVRYRYGPGSEFETHSHPEEQMTIGLSGQLEFVMNGKTHMLGPGDVFFIPGDVPHSARNIGDVEVLTLNFFSSPKKGF